MTREWENRIDDESRLTGKITDMILKEHGARGMRAIEAVSEERVKEYLDFIVVVGEEDEYIIEGESCTCKDYQYNLNDGEWCWHIIANKIAQATDDVDEHDMWYSEVSRPSLM